MTGTSDKKAVLPAFTPGCEIPGNYTKSDGGTLRQHQWASVTLLTTATLELTYIRARLTMISKRVVICIFSLFLHACSHSDFDGATQSNSASAPVEQGPSMEAQPVSDDEEISTNLRRNLFNGYVLVKKTWRSSDDTLTIVDFWEHDSVARTISHSVAVNRPEAVSGNRVHSRVQYDERGYPVKQNVFDRDGEPHTMYLSEFSSDGQLLQTRSFKAGLPEETGLSEFSYDTSNRPVQVIFRLARNETAATTGTFSYSGQGLLTTYVSDNGSDVFTYEFVYDSNGLPVSKTSSSASGNFFLWESFQFNADGNLLLNEIYDETGAQQGTLEYEYQRVENPVYNARLMDLIYAPNKY